MATISELQYPVVGLGDESEEHDPMTPAEFRMVRDWLGVTGDWLAEHLGVAGRTIRRWEHGTSAIPDGVREALESLEQEQAVQVDDLVQQLRDAAVITLTIPDHSQGDFPAGWWRMVAMMVATHIPGLTVRYP